MARACRSWHSRRRCVTLPVKSSARVNMLVDITERKRSEEQITILAHEAEHRCKNVLAVVQATVHLTQADTPHDLKTAIQGRLQALANAHALFVRSRWAGADLRSLVAQELSPYCQDGQTSVEINGPSVVLEPNNGASNCSSHARARD